jgi:uncharacterized GH25 family protein
LLIRFTPSAGNGAVRRTVLAAAALLLADSVQAHDFWIEPSTFHPMPGATVAVGLRVGQNFVGDPVPRLSRSIEQFFIRQGGDELPIGGSDNIDPAGILRADGQSTAIIAYRSAGSFIEQPADKFEDYLRQEGIERIIDLRAKRGEHEKPGRERFYRYAKALLTGQQPSPSVTQPLGLAYEIVPDDDPTARSAPFRGRVLYDGKPLAGALVVAMRHSDASVRLTARSDEQGAFTFVLPRAGVWLIKSVHMVRASFFSDADWESLWASLTFEAPGPP